MNVVITLALTVVIFVPIAPLQVPVRPEGEVVEVIQGFLADDFNTEWRGVENYRQFDGQGRSQNAQS